MLKDIKSEVSADCICSNKGIIITTNKVTVYFNLNIMKKYIKKLNNIDSNDIMSPRLSQSKSYLKFLGILYFMEDTDLLIIPDIIERVIQSTHIFNNLVLTSYL